MIKEINISKRKCLTIKATRLEKAQMQKQADKYANGNLSAWVRYAALNYIPTAQELSINHDTSSNKCL